ncbi:chlorohydrolase [Streptococcus pneumoniae]|nr:chlorohydrolase [Streptococcus pneumoniae]VJR89012.1 chlorohydrolase [Streptococcus pneumoniae]VNK50017.1 chlorohydrolase [Streptococcus pneumoniae]VPN29027.1 chlorohydrolase [Streptococcus pneumoniae]VTG84035.1 chlorohydrolase [Streptococcus pneumoniae]
MKIKEQTRKLAAGCSKHCFEVVDKTDEVSSKHCFEVVDRTDEVSNHTYSKATLTRFEEIFEEYKIMDNCLLAFYWEKDECNRVHLFLFMVK